MAQEVIEYSVEVRAEIVSQIEAAHRLAAGLFLRQATPELNRLTHILDSTKRLLTIHGTRRELNPTEGDVS